MRHSVVVDAEARAAALNVKKSFCVSAPAGSGKTELLTQRFLKLLAQVEKPEQIQAITFTRKAAAEMRERIVQALRIGQISEPPEQPHRHVSWQLAQRALQQSVIHDWQLVDNPQRLRIQTIDSLCHNIARDQPVLSQIGGSLQPIDNAAPLYEKAINNFFTELESDSPVASDIALLLYHLGNNAKRLQELFVQMLPIRDQWLPGVSVVRQEQDIETLLDNTLKKWIAEELGCVRKALNHTAADLVLCADFAAGFLLENSDISADSPVRTLAGLTQLPMAVPEHHRQWLGIVSLLLTNDFKPRKRLDKKLGFPAKSDKKWGEQSQRFKQLMSDIIDSISSDDDLLYRLKTIAMLPALGYANSDKPLLDALTHCLVQLCGQLELVFGETQQCDHNEVAIRALRALGAQNGDTVASATAYKWSQQLRHLLVDEFQDTSERQFELIEALTNDWPQYNADTHNLPNTLFIVGDGMQSIYSFREAKVGLFLQAKTQGIGGLSLEPVNLQQNFRSTTAIVNWVNQHFSKAFPSQMNRSQGAVPYSASVSFEADNAAHKQEENEAAVEVVACIKNEVPETAAIAEASHIVTAIKAAYAHTPATEIAILVRARSHLTYILPALDAADIHWQGVDIDPLAQREVIMDCMTLVSALCNPADNIAWYALLRAPFCGIQLFDLQVIKDVLQQQDTALFLANYLCSASANEFDLLNKVMQEQMSDEGWRRLQCVCHIIEAAWQSRAKNSFRHWVESVWRALGGDYIAEHSAAGNDSRSAEAFFELLESFEQNDLSVNAAIDIRQLRRKVESLYAKSFSASASETPAVQIMTMHKAKGLEYDIVFLPGLHTGTVSSNKPLLITHTRIFNDGGVGLALSPIPKPTEAVNKGGRGEVSIYEFLREQEKRLKNYELLRLLYVAATRARRKLVLLAAIEEQPDGELKDPGKGSLLAPLWPTIKADVRRVYGNAQVELEPQPGFELLPLRRFTLEALLKLNNALNTAAPEVDESNALDRLAHNLDESSANGESEYTRIVGICAHEIFEQIAKLGWNYWRSINLVSLKPHWSIRLAELGMQADEITVAADSIEIAVTKLMTSKHAEMFFSDKHCDAHSEWALTCYEAGQTQRLVLDLSFIDSNHTRWVIDYKMAQPVKSQPKALFLAQQQQQYAEKMQQYRKAVERYDQEHNAQVRATRCALYFPLLDNLCEIDAV